MPSSALQAGSVVASKYRIESASEASNRRMYLAHDEAADRSYHLVELTEAETGAATALISVSHAHLAKVLEVATSDDGRKLLVVEHIDGTTLEAALADEGGRHSSPVDAVRATLRIVDALAAVHAAGTSHGFVCPGAVIAEPSDRGGPVLSFSVDGPSQYVSPERRETSGPPSEADDAWAAAGLLYRALIGEDPPQDGLAPDVNLADLGVSDDLLAKLLVHGLASDGETRARDLKTLKRDLARWFVGHASDEPILPSQGHAATEPPPLPAGSQPLQGHVPAVSSSSAPTAGRRRTTLMAIAGIIGGLGAAWAWLLMRPAPKHFVQPAPAASSARPEKKAIDLSEVPVTGKDEALLPGDKMGACVAGYLPKGSLGQAPDLSWLCSETDPREGAMKLRVAVIKGAPRNARPTEAMKLFATMGWYDMCALAVIRAGCCTDAPPLTLPKPAPECPAMDAALREIGRSVVGGQSYDEALKTYTSAIHCELNAGRGKELGHSERPAGGEATAFGDFVKAFQQQ